MVRLFIEVFALRVDVLIHGTLIESELARASEYLVFL